MIFFHKNKISGSKIFRISSKINTDANECLCKNVFKEFWKGFSFHLSEIEFFKTKDNVFRVGICEVPSLDDEEYAISIRESGIAIVGKDNRGLIEGYMTLLDMIECDDDGAFISCCDIKEHPLIKRRMIHFCLFPETELWQLEKFIRLCGALKYSHIIIEFWGTLKYDVMKELSWNTGFTKDEIRPLVCLANDLGMEIVPMFNHWGHASASRVRHGKHVVLDQNPTLQSYFSDDGWCWDISKKKVRNLLSSIRNELISVCGSGELFHVGCDEAYNFEYTEENVSVLCDFLNEISESLKKFGRRAIVWGDMFVANRDWKNKENIYTAACPSINIENSIRNHLSRDLIIADWQYECNKVPVETSIGFKTDGFDVLLCPWDRSAQESMSCTDTVKVYNLFGVIHTTWHTLSVGMPYITRVALASWENAPIWTGSGLKTQTASLMRKTYFSYGDFKKSGWSIGDISDK